VKVGLEVADHGSSSSTRKSNSSEKLPKQEKSHSVPARNVRDAPTKQEREEALEKVSHAERLFVEGKGIVNKLEEDNSKVRCALEQSMTRLDRTSMDSDFSIHRGCDVYLVQPTGPPANENIMELLITIYAYRISSAKNITAVILYFGYARADRKTHNSSRCRSRDLAYDLYSGQSMGYFNIPVDHDKLICSNDLVVVSPDVGGVARALVFAKKLSDAPLAIVDKRRNGHNVAEVMNLNGDVKGKVAVMVDDMIDTVETISKGNCVLNVMVNFCKSEVKLHCSCNRYEAYGLLCRHAFYVLRMNNVKEFPKNYVHKRWLKNVKPSSFGRRRITGASDVVYSEVLELYQIFESTIDRLVHDLDKLHIYKDKMKELLNQVEINVPTVLKVSSKAVMSAMLGVDEPDNVLIGNPNLSKVKGNSGIFAKYFARKKFIWDF
ncbi:FAR1 DNA binding domain, zinc finger, SWIM-type, MULE transposase domain containing protein, partial [Tanacetum coccineum]